MQMDLETLTKLLGEFHQELKTCMENRQDELHDPILLGDFIVDTYNNYLAIAKTACNHPIVQTMPEVGKLNNYDSFDYDIRKGVGNHPQLGKMQEVAMATRRLQTILQGGAEMKADSAQRELNAVVTLLKNLGAQIEQTNRLDNSEEGLKTVQNLVIEYNRCLSTVMAVTDDAIIPKMFRSLEVKDKQTSPQAKLSELRLAQSGLLSYLRETPDIRRIIPYSREDARNISDDEADWVWRSIPVPDPLGEDVQAFAAQSTLRGDEEDVNAKVWGTWETDDQGRPWAEARQGWKTIDGRWRGRCHSYDGDLSNDEDWSKWNAQIREIDGWVHIFMYDTNEDPGGPIVIKARREGNRLLGRHVFVLDACVSGPWVGLIVNNRRIDGEYKCYTDKERGRRDFRR